MFFVASRERTSVLHDPQIDAHALPPIYEERATKEENYLYPDIPLPSSVEFRDTFVLLFIFRTALSTSRLILKISRRSYKFDDLFVRRLLAAWEL